MSVWMWLWVDASFRRGDEGRRTGRTAGSSSSTSLAGLGRSSNKEVDNSLQEEEREKLGVGRELLGDGVSLGDWDVADGE